MMEWILSASFLILVVLVLRALLGRRIGAGLRYGLWVVVLVRLLVPVSFLTLALPQLPAWTMPEIMREESIYVLPVDSAPLEDSGVRITEDGAVMDSNSFGYPHLADDGENVVRFADRISPLELLGWVWLGGAALMGTVLIAANLRFAIRLRRVRKPLAGTSAPVPVYQAPGLPSPCLMGPLRPAVYVTEEAAADPVMLRHVLAHELTHYSHLDHLWSVLRGAALAVHWWNPLVWLAVVCSRRDGELACDEGALKRLGDGERTAYGETLLALVTSKRKPGDLLSFATTMSGGKRSLRERIRFIARRPKRLVSAMAVAVAVAALSSVVAFGQAEKDASTGTPVDPAEDDTRLEDAWKTAKITVDADGVPHIRYTLPDGGEEMWNGAPIPAPVEWADDDLAGRNEAETLTWTSDDAIWAKMVSPTDGWLVVTYGHGVALADTYVYKTTDRGVTWTEVEMPWTSWHIADVGFLSPDRLIIAQRLFDSAPCLITKDGGKTWEEIELPDAQVLSILFDGETVVMDVGGQESGPAKYTMLSHDMGDSWMTSSPAGLRRTMSVDLDHDGFSDRLELRQLQKDGTEQWELSFTASYMSSPTWSAAMDETHSGCNTYFLYQKDSLDYLLEYMPKMQQGFCTYSYRLFHLETGGEEVTDRENSVEFDINFMHTDHRFDPAEIAAFMEEVNSIIVESQLLVSTDHWSLDLKEDADGRLYDDILGSLNAPDEEDIPLEEALERYARQAADHPDDTWSPLADLLYDLTEEDILMFDGDTSALVRMLQAGERGSRFYTWSTKEDAYLGHAGDEVDYNIWDIPLADGNTLWLMACEERASVLVMLETTDETVSAFYDAPELRTLLIGSKAMNTDPDEGNKLAFTVDTSGLVITGLDAAHVEWLFPNDVDPHGSLYFDRPAFLGEAFAGKKAEGNAIWTGENQIHVCIVEQDPQIVAGAIVGPYAWFSVDLDSGTVVDEFPDTEPESDRLELTEQEMLSIATILAELSTTAENYYTNLHN